MIKLDDDLLLELGLGALPPEDKKRMLTHIYETLEMRVGMELAKQMSDAQLNEFEQFITRNDEPGALQWLETNFPNYKDVVAAEFEKLKAEIKQVAPQILHDAQAAAQGQPQQQVPASAGMPGQQYSPAQPQPAYGPAPAGQPYQYAAPSQQQHAPYTAPVGQQYPPAGQQQAHWQGGQGPVPAAPQQQPMYNPAPTVPPAGQPWTQQQYGGQTPAAQASGQQYIPSQPPAGQSYPQQSMPQQPQSSNDDSDNQQRPQQPYAPTS